ncbi:MAG TPA: hypothetical protein VIM47_06480 [Dermatophilaceae bacterium]|jgi:heme/copper-type cytochrome/quinol oxidase subunit 2
MIRQHPGRVLSVTALIAVFFVALSYPGRADTAGAWYYISAIGWFGFLITFVVLIVLAVIAAVHRSSGRRRAVSS